MKKEKIIRQSDLKKLKKNILDEDRREDNKMYMKKSKRKK